MFGTGDVVASSLAGGHSTALDFIPDSQTSHIELHNRLFLLLLLFLPLHHRSLHMRFETVLLMRFQMVLLIHLQPDFILICWCREMHFMLVIQWGSFRPTRTRRLDVLDPDRQPGTYWYILFLIINLFNLYYFCFALIFQLIVIVIFQVWGQRSCGTKFFNTIKGYFTEPRLNWTLTPEHIRTTWFKCFAVNFCLNNLRVFK